MVVFPNAKINLGLHVTQKRDDGFHDLQTVFFPIPLCDALEIIPANDNETGIVITGITVDTDPQQNLCMRAYHLLKKDFPQLPAIKLHLHKAIPLGAGMGGGSADAAFTLVLLNQYFLLGIPEEKLMQYALQLGSDCPFFIINQPCFATGRGEELERTAFDLSAYQITIVNPGIHIQTKEAFAAIVPAQPMKSIKDIIAQPVESWKKDLKNDFEPGVFKLYPEIAAIKDKLYDSGAVYASMTGTGSTVYGIFKKGMVPAQDVQSSRYKVQQQYFQLTLNIKS